MTYVSQINAQLRQQIAKTKDLIVYGQNITAGSCLSGLTRGIEAGSNGKIFNSQNSENMLAGVGFGLMLKGINAAFFMKQQDFLLLGLDHVVNTWNVLRTRDDLVASFTIVTIIVDSGFEGPQSRLNNFNDICSLANVPGYVITNRWDAEHIIEHRFVKPGFRIIGVSQRMFAKEMPETENAPVSHEDGDILEYAKGEDVTIVAFNLAFNQALELWSNLDGQGIRASLFSVPAVLPRGWSAIIEDALKTGSLIVIDDSKSENRSSDRLMLEISRAGSGVRIAHVNRPFTNAGLSPNQDLLDIDIPSVLKEAGLS